MERQSPHGSMLSCSVVQSGSEQGGRVFWAPQSPEKQARPPVTSLQRVFVVMGMCCMAYLSPLAQAVSPATPKGDGAPQGVQSISEGRPFLLPAFLLVSSLLTEDYVTSKEGRPGVLPKAASESVFAAVIFSAGICFMQTGFRGFSWMLLFHLTCKG